jgi:YgiT-type zinc finger domain-containing protein
MGKRPQDKEKKMTCHICGGKLERLITNLPFKVDDNSIVIIKDLPVLQCRNCSEYLIEDAVMERIDAILSHVDTVAELEILRYVA